MVKQFNVGDLVRFQRPLPGHVSALRDGREQYLPNHLLEVISRA